MPTPKMVGAGTKGVHPARAGDAPYIWNIMALRITTGPVESGPRS